MKQPFNSLFEMPQFASQVLSQFGAASFNSLFEMQLNVGEDRLRAFIAFNSLFEMLGGIEDKVVYDSQDLSILYLRCLRPTAPPMRREGGDFQFSI